MGKKIPPAFDISRDSCSFLNGFWVAIAARWYGSDNRLLLAVTEDHLQSDDVDSVKADAVELRST